MHVTCKKFGKKRLRALLESLYGLSAIEGRERLNQQFEAWKGGNEQTDDVCVAVYRLG